MAFDQEDQVRKSDDPLRRVLSVSEEAARTILLELGGCVNPPNLISRQIVAYANPERGKVMTSNRELRVGDRVQHALTRRKGTIIEIEGNTVLVRWTHRTVDDTIEEAAELILI